MLKYHQLENGHILQLIKLNLTENRILSSDMTNELVRQYFLLNSFTPLLMHSVTNCKFDVDFRDMVLRVQQQVNVHCCMNQFVSWKSIFQTPLMQQIYQLQILLSMCSMI
ncbi:Hypothetical_protein [Hexamita inflata]|uniref:Hypothetical_protein n=1 Tax=Hexamita inflata TaxID=28002 RepID=A0AA86QC49_9EUKA|nr:Hypothetical protein HINF_LOCUS42910 [Hexamita inflata]CAI9955268.1 Hypothetical protein HINF_LOCUS42913 [Hexamita inflata]